MAKSGDIQQTNTLPADVSAAPVLDPVAVDQVVLVPLDLIDATDRLREVNEAYAQVLAHAFQGPGGQRTPIEIVRRGERYRLVYGAHRFRAAEINGQAEIKAIATDASDAELRLREIDENLIRHELTALDRARFLAERKRLYEALNPAARHGGDRPGRGLRGPPDGRAGRPRQGLRRRRDRLADRQALGSDRIRLARSALVPVGP